MGSESSNKIHAAPHTQSERVGSACFYGVSSLAVIFVNKVILTEYNFEYFVFLAGAQFLSTSLILYGLSAIHRIELPSPSWAVVREVAPISVMFFLNVVTGLGSTKALNLPMFTALRRFSILMTMMGEYHILGKEPSSVVVLSVVMMVGGAVVAALNDLTFDATGYTLVLLNDVFTALNGIYLKRATLSGRLSKLGILFYNSLLSGILVSAIYIGDHAMTHLSEQSVGPGGQFVPVVSKLQEVMAFPLWSDTNFCCLFVGATFMGTILNYSTFLCTSVNSALTTTVVGCLKNVLTTYVGMVFMAGYEYSTLNSLGLNISILGSLYYTYVNLFKSSSPAALMLPMRKHSSESIDIEMPAAKADLGKA